MSVMKVERILKFDLKMKVKVIPAEMTAKVVHTMHRIAFETNGVIRAASNANMSQMTTYHRL